MYRMSRKFVPLQCTVYNSLHTLFRRKEQIIMRKIVLTLSLELGGPVSIWRAK